MFTNNSAARAVGDFSTERFKREMTREPGRPTKLYPLQSNKYDGLGGFERNSAKIPARAIFWAAVVVVGVIGFVRIATAAGFY